MSRIYDATRHRRGQGVAPGPAAKTVQRFPTAESVQPQDGARQSRTLTRAREAYQCLAESVRRAWPRSDNLLAFGLNTRVLLVASAVHGEGTSTVARNLAGRLSDGDSSRVVLVDANLRVPSQHHALGISPPPPGLTEVIRGRVSLDRATYRGSRSTPAFLSCGGDVSAPASLLATMAARKVFRELGSRFDWVVVDGPPVARYSDAASLACAADAALLVVKAESTRHEVVQQALRTLEDCKLRVLGAVLNRRRYHLPEWAYRRLG